MAARVKKRLTGPHKVAILLRLLDYDVSKEIVRNLGDRDLARIHRADTDLGKPNEEVVLEVAPYPGENESVKIDERPVITSAPARERGEA